MVSENGRKTEAWPALPYEEWRATQQTLHMWMQIVGKVKLELAPFLNEWWNTALHYAARGITTGLIPYGDRAFEIRFDFLSHNLSIETTDGAIKALPLVPRSVADFYLDIMDSLRAIGIDTRINPLPSEVPNPIPFDTNRVDASYDPDPVTRWWEVQTQTVKVLQRYRSSFVGKSSPIHFFWGSFDLNHTRFSGRPAPRAEGAPRFYQIAEDQENVACGFWPGNPNALGVALGEPAFYSYIYPAPAGYAEARVRPDEAHFDPRLGEFILRYEDVRTATSPEETLLEFFTSTYEVAASLAGWDRAHLEAAPPG